MEYSHRYHAYPTQEVAAALEHHIAIHRRAYNDTLYESENAGPDDIGVTPPRPSGRRSEGSTADRSYCRT